MTIRQIKRTKMVCLISIIVILLCSTLGLLSVIGYDIFKPRIQEMSWQELDKNSKLIGEMRAKKIERFFNENPQEKIENVIYLKDCGNEVVAELKKMYRD